MTQLTLILTALTLLFWGLTHFDLGARPNRATFIATGVLAVLAAVSIILTNSSLL